MYISHWLEECINIYHLVIRTCHIFFEILPMRRNFFFQDLIWIFLNLRSLFVLFLLQADKILENSILLPRYHRIFRYFSFFFFCTNREYKSERSFFLSIFLWSKPQGMKRILYIYFFKLSSVIYYTRLSCISYKIIAQVLYNDVYYFLYLDI